jgi:hypothetical protein
MIVERQFQHRLIREIFAQPVNLGKAIEPRLCREEGLVHLEDIRIPSEELRTLPRILGAQREAKRRVRTPLVS